MQQKESPTELGRENVRRLLFQYAIPSVIAMTAASLYNITDSAFIGQGVGPLAISGLAITFPLVNLSVAFGTLIGVGAATLMSLRLGQNDYSSANNILGNAFSMNLIIGLLYTVLVLIFLDPILYFFGASADTIPYARDYMTVVTLGNSITHMFFGSNALLRAIGNPRRSMYATIYSVIINIVLTPLFIYVFGWGIRGAALATVIAQTTMLSWQLRYFTGSRSFIRLKWKTFRLQRRIVADSLAIGISPFLMNVATSTVVILINQGLIRHGGDLAVGAYGIVNRVAALFMMVVIGLNQGMQPIAGYNYGAAKYDRVRGVLNLSILLATAVMTAGFLISELFPHAVASVFTTDEELIAIAAPGLRTVMLFYPIVGFQMVTSNFFQSIGMPGKSIFMSLTRQVLFLLPLLLILPAFWGVKGVWFSMPAADFLASIVAALMLRAQYRKFRNNA
ncbi:MAG: MATE family efflux transporter [Mangrovibacterium sp.]